MKKPRMSDEELDKTIETLCAEREQRRIRKAKAAGMTVSDDDNDFTYERTIFNTPIGVVLLWSSHYGAANICIEPVDASEFIYGLEECPDEWTNWADAEIGDDAFEVLGSRSKGEALHHFMKLYDKYEELLRQMSVLAVQKS